MRYVTLSNIICGYIYIHVSDVPAIVVVGPVVGLDDTVFGGATSFSCAGQKKRKMQDLSHDNLVHYR